MQRNVMEVVGAQWLQRSNGRERSEGGGLVGLGVAEEEKRGIEIIICCVGRLLCVCTRQGTRVVVVVVAVLVGVVLWRL